MSAQGYSLGKGLSFHHRVYCVSRGGGPLSEQLLSLGSFLSPQKKFKPSVICSGFRFLYYPPASSLRAELS